MQTEKARIMGNLKTVLSLSVLALTILVSKPLSALPVGFELTSTLLLPFNDSVDIEGVTNQFGISRDDGTPSEQLEISVNLNSQGGFEPGLATDFDIFYGEFTDLSLQGRAIWFETDPSLSQVSILFELTTNLINGDPFLFVQAVVADMFDDPAGLLTLGSTEGAIDVFEGAIRVDPAPVPVSPPLLMLLSALVVFVATRFARGPGQSAVA
ncbi:hypothetical protein [Jannaschia sp. CCS1]|uniref:hypothetical protein n=1 Tax=Jannaschia sp. (strain CCS1) TaxID=290400 RepID=UPI00140FA078|nr:hypothetical protein [Jannaschia sp. CCS1]